MIEKMDSFTAHVCRRFASGSPTQRAPDKWESARFQEVSVASSGSVKAA